MPGLIQDDRGNNSWMRAALSVVLIVLIGGSVLLYRDWRMMMLAEISRDKPDYTGIDALFKSMMIGFVGGVLIVIFGKVIQKYFEK